ncbi:MAG: hypothetical protein LRZ84_13130 [Desertifilum sp.]|nr:hypothetical protein [Desertifilum sp.]
MALFASANQVLFCQAQGLPYFEFKDAPSIAKVPPSQTQSLKPPSLLRISTLFKGQLLYAMPYNGREGFPPISPGELKMSVLALIVALIGALWVTQIFVIAPIDFIDWFSFPQWLILLVTLGLLSWLIGD